MTEKAIKKTITVRTKLTIMTMENNSIIKN